MNKTAKELLNWYAEYKGYQLSANKHNKTKVYNRILAYLYIDLAQGLLTDNKIQANKALRGIGEFLSFNQEMQGISGELND